MNMIRELFSSSGFMPHGFCYQWKPSLIWLHSLSDILIAIAYFSIPLALIYLVQKKRNLPFDWMFVCFGVFIAACGATHLMEVVTLWIPIYWTSGGVKVITALASVPTAILLVRAIPKALSLPSPEELRRANEELARQAAVLREQAALLELSQDAILVQTLEGKNLHWNQGAERMYGWTKAEGIGQINHDLLETRFPQPRSEIVATLLATGYWEGELQQRRRDGQNIIVSSRWALGRGFDGGVQKVLKIDIDVTEQKRAEEAMRVSEERFRMMADNIEEIFWLLDPKSLEVLYLSRAFESICERPLASIYADRTSYREIIHPDDRQHALSQLALLEKSNEIRERFRIVCPSGKVKWVEVRGFAARDSAGKVTALVGTAQDITEQRRAEEALRESEDRYRDLVEHSQDLICTHDLRGRLLSVNELPTKILGYSKEELLGKPMKEFLCEETRPQLEEYLSAIRKEGSADGIIMVLTKSGEKRLWEYHNTLRTEGVNEPVVRGIAHDVTEQKRAERALRFSEEKFSKAFQASPYAIVISTIEEGRIIDVNESFVRVMGSIREQAIGQTSQELGLWTNPADRIDMIEELRQTGRVNSKQIVFRTRDGQHLVVNLSAETIEVGGRQCLMSVCEDITERKRAEEGLRKLSGRLLQLQDEERRRIARDLHDATGQDLVALSSTLGHLRTTTPRSSRKLRKSLLQCQMLADRSIREIRTLSYLLHPPMLDEAGLEDAIRHYVRGYAERTGIEVQLDFAPDFGRLAREEELALFRVMQESLVNIHRHSGSFGARILLHRKLGQILLEVSDNGRGMSGNGQGESTAFSFGGGVGIQSMHERMKQVGGRLEIESTRKGTTVWAMIPGLTSA